MIPAVIWIGGVATLLAVWVEAVVAAPLWAFAHLSTEGEGVGQQAQHGYLFIMNVLFRPCLMVVGFVLGAIMVSILTNYVMQLFPIIIANANADSYTGLIKIAAYYAAFIIILQTVVSMSFSMIRVVPDQVLGWVGGNTTNNVGQQAEDVVGGAAKNAFAGRGSLGGQSPFGKAKQAAGDKQNASDKEDATQARHSEMIGTMGSKSSGSKPSKGAGEDVMR